MEDFQKYVNTTPGLYSGKELKVLVDLSGKL